MTSTKANPETLSVLDRPNSYIGKTVPRPNLDRLMQGRGLYVSDIELPRMAHVVFLRSPHAHAMIKGIDASAAKRMSGVIAVVSGAELSTIITPNWEELIRLLPFFVLVGGGGSWVRRAVSAGLGAAIPIGAYAPLLPRTNAGHENPIAVPPPPQRAPPPDRRTRGGT